MFGFLAPVLKAATGIGSALFGGGNAGATLGGIAQVLGGVANLKQAGQQGPSPRDNLMSQAQGARDAAAEYGFNPLTMLQLGQTGAMAGGGGGGAAPLASIQMLTDGLKDISDVASGDAARRRQRDILELDMAKIALDKARSGVFVAPQSSTNFPSSPSPLGRRAVTVVQEGSAPVRSVDGGISTRPVPHPFHAKRELIPVLDAGGHATVLPRGIADRLGISVFGQMVGEDNEAMYGEKAGEYIGVADTPSAIEYSFSGKPSLVPSTRSVGGWVKGDLKAPGDPNNYALRRIRSNEAAEYEAAGIEVVRRGDALYVRKH